MEFEGGVWGLLGKYKHKYTGNEKYWRSGKWQEILGIMRGGWGLLRKYKNKHTLDMNNTKEFENDKRSEALWGGVWGLPGGRAAAEPTWSLLRLWRCSLEMAIIIIVMLHCAFITGLTTIFNHLVSAPIIKMFLYIWWWLSSWCYNGLVSQGSLSFLMKANLLCYMEYKTCHVRQRCFGSITTHNSTLRLLVRSKAWSHNKDELSLPK